MWSLQLKLGLSLNLDVILWSSPSIVRVIKMMTRFTMVQRAPTITSTTSWGTSQLWRQSLHTVTVLSGNEGLDVEGPTEIHCPLPVWLNTVCNPGMTRLSSTSGFHHFHWSQFGFYRVDDLQLNYLSMTLGFLLRQFTVDKPEDCQHWLVQICNELFCFTAVDRPHRDWSISARFV